MRYVSFVIRLWLPDSQSDPESMELRGSIEHVQSGMVVQITSLEIIPDSLSELLESRTEDGESEGPAGIKWIPFDQ